MAERSEQLPVVIANMHDLCAVHRVLQGLDEAVILQVANAAAGVAAGGWLAQARAIGELQMRARYRSEAVKEHAKRLGIGRSTAFELGAIDRAILLPRLLDKGDAATFTITAKRFYVCALKLGEITGRSPLAILAIAEAARAKNRRFSTRKLREQLGVTTTPDPTKSIAGCLAKLSALQRKARRSYALTVADPVAALRMVEAAAENTQHLVADLKARLGEAD